MKKIIFSFLTLIGLLFLPIHADAATASVKVTASSSKINLGGSVTATVTVTGSVAIGSWQYNLVYDTSKLTLTSSNNSTFIVDYASNGSTYKKTYTYTFKSKALGSASISVKNAAVADFATVSDMSVTTSGCTVTVASYSSNANLSSLSITDGELNPVFSADTTTYNVSLPNTVSSVTISAQAADKAATIGGTGTFTVAEGSNAFNVVVTAENGTSKTYTLNVDVSEKNPINVKIDNKDYTIVRNSGKVTTPVGYTDSTVMINDNEIASYKSDITKLTLVVLKDTDGNFVLATYDEDKDEYSLYTQLSSNGIIIYLMEPDSKIKIPLGYKSTEVTINDIKIKSWNLPDGENKGLYLIYGMNVETGAKGFYQYDNIDETFQRFANDQVVSLNKDLNQTKMELYIAIAASALLVLIGLIVLIIKLMKKTKSKKVSKREKQIIDSYKE